MTNGIFSLITQREAGRLNAHSYRFRYIDDPLSPTALVVDLTCDSDAQFWEYVIHNQMTDEHEKVTRDEAKAFLRQVQNALRIERRDAQEADYIKAMTGGEMEDEYNDRLSGC